jgi:hypothetical protein
MREILIPLLIAVLAIIAAVLVAVPPPAGAMPLVAPDGGALAAGCRSLNGDPDAAIACG